MKRKQIILMLAVIIIFFSAGLAMAGSAYKVQCENKNCRFFSEVMFGGGFKFDQATGYCKKCRKFVYLTWERGKNKSSIMGDIWCPLTGQDFSIFRCPSCSGPVLQINSIEDLKYCPSCRQPALKTTHTLLFD